MLKVNNIFGYGVINMLLLFNIFVVIKCNGVSIIVIISVNRV